MPDSLRWKRPQNSAIVPGCVVPEGDSYFHIVAVPDLSGFQSGSRDAISWVEVHGANGYLPDQFLQTVSNKRTDKWGGDEEGRTRSIREVVDDRGCRRRRSSRYLYQSLEHMARCCLCADLQAVGLILYDFPDMGMPDPRPTFAYLATALRDKHPKLAYLHIWNGGEGGDKRAFISAGGYTRESALRTVEDKGGLIAFGELYISNPDLLVQLQKNIPLTRSDRSKYYLAGNLTPFGYSDWSFADGGVQQVDARL
ncbi:hypothetical protein JVT61DRAFT_12265 [Boletus reticuloceps]|uniref:NADH:flavin oxidoreductase/NADH oxidase N-terminal domain-containing protein n=1 Tax=Boletus reticuloceps TaxID=495285 RepID=A0A8I2YEC1_9AGAM|nr:hypothetical protein JVT61DRAFT_12265 [Boletus reticuloceps]